MGRLKPRSRWPLSNFIGALSTTFLPMAASTCAMLTMPTGSLCRENNPPVGFVTTTASPPSRRTAAAPFSTRSPTSRRGAGRITSATRVCARRECAGRITSSPTVPRISWLRLTRSGTGCCARSGSRMSISVSSGSHSAPSCDATMASSGICRLQGEHVICNLSRRHDSDGRLVLVHHDGQPARCLSHELDHLRCTLVLVDEKRLRAEHVAGEHVGCRRTHGEVAAGDDDLSCHQAIENVLLPHVPNRPAIKQ